jgi:hypothetical protein
VSVQFFQGKSELTPILPDAAQARGLKVKTGIKAGALGHNRKFGYKKWPCLHIRTFNA